MAEEKSELTAALDEARKRRADLHAALIDVERAISGPATGREQQWSTEVVTRLLALRDALDEHIEATERSGGLYDEITNRAPRLSNAIQRLQAEHPELRSAISQMIERLQATPVGASWPLGEARDDLQRLLGRVVKHRQLGADLVWEAYNLDIGGIE
jgi:chromosome segregation ATPase